MKFDDIPGIIHHMEQASPEARAAQAAAEREQLSAYRSKKIKIYRDWSDPKKRDEIMFGDTKYKDVKAEELKSQEELKKEFWGTDPELTYSKYAVRPLDEFIKPSFNFRAIYKEPPAPPKTKWRRLKDWLFGTS